MRFDFAPYPLWRRRPALMAAIAPTLLRPFYPVDADTQPPATTEALARFLARWHLLPRGVSEAEACYAMATHDGTAESAITPRQFEVPMHPIRLPAQWEQMETILLRFPVLYPPLWPTYAQMVKAIAPAAQVTIIVPAPSWAAAVCYFLRTLGIADMAQIRLLHVPTDDIWIRDYGPFVGYTADGRRACVDAIFDPLGSYPQEQDDRLPRSWAAYAGIPSYQLDFRTEGGNYWSDGAGTLLVSDEMLTRHPHMSREAIEAKLREAFLFDKLIILPRLLHEETGHVDLVCKLADSTTLLLNRANGTSNDERLRAAAKLLRSETNAQGQPYRVIELPFPRMYRNWGIFNIWRSYTNSLTVNGRVLVPIFGLPEDVEALKIYRAAMPDFAIMPIDCRGAVNGGGAVHCLTKEIPAEQAARSSVD